MRKSRFTEAQIIAILKEAEAGAKVKSRPSPILAGCITGTGASPSSMPRVLECPRNAHFWAFAGSSGGTGLPHALLEAARAQAARQLASPFQRVEQWHRQQVRHVAEVTGDRVQALSAPLSFRERSAAGGQDRTGSRCRRGRQRARCAARQHRGSWSGREAQSAGPWSETGRVRAGSNDALTKPRYSTPSVSEDHHRTASPRRRYRPRLHLPRLLR